MIAERRLRAHNVGHQDVPGADPRLLHVLVVVEESFWRPAAATGAAVTLANENGARLTLVKTTAPTWYSGLTAGSPFGLTIPVEPYEKTCALRLQQATQDVPAWVPVETMLLGARTTRALVHLLKSRSFDAVVASERLLRRGPIRRELVRLGIREVVPIGMELHASRRDRQAARARVQRACAADGD